MDSFSLTCTVKISDIPDTLSFQVSLQLWNPEISTGEAS